jgi:hypothetical protein
VVQLLARTLSLATLAALVVVLLSAPLSGTTSSPDTAAGDKNARGEKVVFLVGGLSSEDLTVLTATTAASKHPGVVLVDTPKSSLYTNTFLAAFKPERVHLVGSFSERRGEVERRRRV